MRMMLKVQVPVDDGNEALESGEFQSVIDDMIERIKPEAVYFFAEHGMRSALAVFDMQNSSEIPAIAEPLFRHLNADVEIIPVMNLDDLRQGLARAGEAPKA